MIVEQSDVCVTVLPVRAGFRIILVSETRDYVWLGNAFENPHDASREALVAAITSQRKVMFKLLPCFTDKATEYDKASRPDSQWRN
jgi:hypothetical protein